MNSSKITILPVLLAIVSAALFGMATPINKLLLDNCNPFTLAGLLYLGASAGLFPVILARREFFQLFRLNRANRTRLSGAIILGGILGPILILFGLKYASASSVSLWLNLELVATTVLGFLFFKDFLGNRGWIGIILALASGVLLTIHEGGSGVISALFVLLACLCWGFDNHFSALIDGISAIQSTFVKGFIAGIINTCIGSLISFSSVPAKTILYALLLGSISYGLSIVFYIISAQKLGAIRSQILFASAPFWGVFFSMIFLSESISPLQLVSFTLLIISIALMISEKHEHFHEHYELDHTHYHIHDDIHHRHDHDYVTGHHEHTHKHKKELHSHPHWPDIHHRHEHDKINKHELM